MLCLIQLKNVWSEGGGGGSCGGGVCVCGGGGRGDKLASKVE